MGAVAVSHRNTGIRRNGDRTRNTRHDLKWNSGLPQSASFLTSAAENKGVATLEPANVLTLAAFIDHDPVNVFLLEIFVTRFFADVDNFGVRPGFFKKVQVDQAVVKNDIGLTKACQSTHGNQIRIPGAGSNDKNCSRLIHDSMISRRRRSAPAMSSCFKYVMISESRIRYCSAFRSAWSGIRCRI